MKQANQFLGDMLDLDDPRAGSDRIWRATTPSQAAIIEGDLVLDVPFEALQKGPRVLVDADVARRLVRVRFRAYTGGIIRLTTCFTDAIPPCPTSPMLEFAPDLQPIPLACRDTSTGWDVADPEGNLKLRVRTAPVNDRNGLATDKNRFTPADPFDVTLFPDSRTAIPFQAVDTFFPMCVESLAMACVEREGGIHRHCFSLSAESGEHFAGTGERFTRLDLAGKTLLLENADGLGVNNRRCYKNIPFYLSSRPYGLFIHTHDHLRLSLADISTRAAQGTVESATADLFFIGGESPERILFNYRRLTGFPPEVALWSYGVWMSRMSYRTAEEVNQVARRLRAERFPCDVLHVDVGWFKEDWVCDWEFCPTKFPDPARWLGELREAGFRVTLWNLPHVGRTSKLYEEAIRSGFAKEPETAGKISESIFSGLEHVATLDFTNPEAVEWYKERWRPLLKMGVAAIKADFGEHIHTAVDYQAMPGIRLHNLFALLYQKAAYEVSREVQVQPLIWARSAWAGAQRYPVHWGGDCAGSWAGLSGSIRGGLHLGLSGFAYWSCDVPGFHGVPDFMNTWPSDTLYMRWTQASTFLSHFRYHGAQPREPYAYPAIADLVRKWWNLRYALIPYLHEEARLATQTGFPLMRAMIFEAPDDPVCWTLDDQFMCGSSILVAPVMNDTGTRSLYLPAGDWLDFWTGEHVQGPCWITARTSPLDTIPVFLRQGAELKLYPEPVLSTDSMNLEKAIRIRADRSYAGLKNTPVGAWIGLGERNSQIERHVTD
jgi:alpha-D-xyloside xylohydrolase